MDDEVLAASMLKNTVDADPRRRQFFSINPDLVSCDPAAME